jgi:hypothetical protein
MRRRTVLLMLAAWLVAAVNIGSSGALARSPIPPPAIAVGLTIALLLLLRVSRAARAAAWSLGPRALVAFHAVRIAAGAYFLVLSTRGTLPGEFAVPAGWGDIVVGTAALIVALRCIPVRTSGQRIALLTWNTVGLIDILMVLANGARLFIGDPAVAAPFTTLPLALLPTFVVPAVIVSHVLLFASPTRERGL